MSLVFNRHLAPPLDAGVPIALDSLVVSVCDTVFPDYQPGGWLLGYEDHGLNTVAFAICSVTAGGHQVRWDPATDRLDVVNPDDQLAGQTARIVFWGV